VVGRNVG